MFGGECLKKICMANSITFFSASSSSLMFRATPPIMLGNIRCLCVSSSTKPTVTEAKTAAGGDGDKVVLVVKKRRSKISLLSNNDSSNRSKKETAAELKENWLDSLSSPFLHNLNPCHSYAGGGGDVDDITTNKGSFSSSAWVIGVDPDVSGAIALLKPDNDHITASSAQVFDSPHVKMLIGKRSRRRLDAKSIVHLLRSFDAPVGTIAYVEQSTPFPQDGKQGWWSGGFGYGLWIGILVASGFSVVPVPSVTWKNKFCLSGSRSSKDDSRELASTIFPSMCSMLKRKKDHGRAEALLIAAYGKGLKLSTNLPEDLTSCHGPIGDNLALSAHKLQLN